MKSLSPACVLVVGALLAAPALAQTAPAPADPCKVSVASRSSGLMAFGVVPPGAPVPPGAQIVWRPMASGPKVTLWIVYPGSQLAHLGEPSGVMIVFPVDDLDSPESLSVQVRTANGRAWRFAGPAIVFNGEQAHVSFTEDTPYSRGVLASITDGQTLTIAVQQEDQTLSQASFVLDNIDSRDNLLADARRELKAAGCRAVAGLG